MLCGENKRHSHRFHYKAAPEATQGYPKATPRPVDSQLIGTTKPPQGYPKATPRLPQGYPKATPRLPQGLGAETTCFPRALAIMRIAAVSRCENRPHECFCLGRISPLLFSDSKRLKTL